MKTHHKVIASIVAATAAVGVYAASHHRVGPADIYPTVPGAVNADIQTPEQVAATLCNPHWSTKTIRPPANYTTGLKVKQLQQLGYQDQNTKDYEEDHLISLELGGSPTDANNLWPEPYNASIPDGGAKMKDTVENFLHKQLCAGKVTLQQAQSEITGDWYAVYQTMKQQSTFGNVEPSQTDETN